MKPRASRVLPVFRSESQARLLAELFLRPRPQDGIPLAHLARGAHVSLATAHREVNRLEEAGIVAGTRIGNVRLLRPNSASPFYPALHALVLRAFGPVAVLSEELRGIPGVERAHVFGSWARRHAGAETAPPPADIDLLVVGCPDPDQVYDACRRAGERLGIEVSATILAPDDWDSRESGFLTSLRAGPLVQVPT